VIVGGYFSSHDFSWAGLPDFGVRKEERGCTRGLPLGERREEYRCAFFVLWL
jgi:hypothetical protein